MKFDINSTIEEMLRAIKGSVSKDWKAVKPVANQFLSREKARLELLASLYISGELTQDEFHSRLEDQKLMLEASLNALAVISKVMAQNAANAAIEVLEKAILLAVKTAL